MRDESWQLESLRRSLVMCASDRPASALTNGEAAELISRLQELERRLRTLQGGVAELLEATSPVPRQNAQLRRVCSRLSALLRASDPQTGPIAGSVD